MLRTRAGGNVGVDSSSAVFEPTVLLSRRANEEKEGF